MFKEYFNFNNVFLQIMLAEAAIVTFSKHCLSVACFGDV